MGESIIHIAIDGPSGSGKSTLAKSLAARLGIDYLDTGAMYRAVGVAALKNGISTKDEPAIDSLLSDIKIETLFEGGVQRMMVNGRDVTDSLRTPRASMAASDVSTLKCVRERLVREQRRIAESRSFVLDGRDIGTVVLPGARHKLFLTADPAERARRRHEELAQKGVKAEYETVFQDTKRRDAQDSGRAIAPLRPAADAVVIDSTGLTASEVLEKALKIIAGEIN